MKPYVRKSKGSVQVAMFLLRSMRAWLMGLLIVGLIVSNIASVLSASFHSALFDAVALPIRSLFPSQATKILKRSPTRVAQHAVEGLKVRAAKATRGLAATKARARGVKTALAKALTREAGLTQVLAVTRGHLAISAERLASANGAIAKHRLAFSNLRGRAVARMLKSKAVNLVSLPTRTVPLAGIVLTLGVAAYDIKTDCDMLDDLDALGKEMGEAVGSDRAKVCGLSFPDNMTLDEIKDVADEAGKSLSISSWFESSAKKK